VHRAALALHENLSHNQPLWQIFLTIFALGFMLQRAAGAVVVYLADGPPMLLAGFALQIAAAFATALGLWLSRGWVVAAIACVGISVVATSFLGVYLHVWPAPIAISQSLVAALATGALALMLRHELGGAAQDRAHPGSK
jgi:hypothetical protein